MRAQNAACPALLEWRASPDDPERQDFQAHRDDQETRGDRRRPHVNPSLHLHVHLVLQVHLDHPDFPDLLEIRGGEAHQEHPEKMGQMEALENQDSPAFLVKWADRVKAENLVKTLQMESQFLVLEESQDHPVHQEYPECLDKTDR